MSSIETESAAPEGIQKDEQTLPEPSIVSSSEVPATAVEESTTSAEISQEKEGGDSLSKDDASQTKDGASPDVEKAESPPVDSNEKQQGENKVIFYCVACSQFDQTLSLPSIFADQAADDSKDSAETAASAPATPSMKAETSPAKTKRMLSESEEPTVAAKVMKV